MTASLFCRNSPRWLCRRVYRLGFLVPTHNDTFRSLTAMDHRNTSNWEMDALFPPFPNMERIE